MNLWKHMAWSMVLAAGTALGQLAAPGEPPTVTSPGSPDTSTSSAPVAGAGRPTVIVVIAAEGAPEFGAAFEKAADRMIDAANKGNARLVVIGRDPVPDNAPPRDKDILKVALDEEFARPDGPLWIVLIGHGTFDGRQAKLNLRGPDVADQELAQWLNACRRPLALVNCTSASAPFLSRLSAPGRVIITATRSGNEVNYARFADYFTGAVADPAADLDKDGQTSLLEAFLAASHRVAEFYKTEARMLTEHALLDDNGDALGVSAEWFEGIRATRAARTGAPIDGARAHQWHLVMSPEELALSPDMRARRDELELRIESLRSRKPGMDEQRYFAELDALMLELARLYRQSPAAVATQASTPQP